jgi:hypothetical protein
VRRRATGALLAGLLAGQPGARTASADSCAALPTPIFVVGSTAAQPLLAEIGKLMAGDSPPATVVYFADDSCAAVDAILSGTALSGSGANSPVYWDGTGARSSCDVTSGGVAAHLGISDVFATTCYALPGGLPATVADDVGPVQAMTFATHRSSTERTISAEAAYYVFGFGSDSHVSPWTFEASIFKRDALSGTQRMIAAAIGVPPDRWKGTTTASSSDMITRLATANFPDLSIGVLPAGVARDGATMVRVLAYQNAGQSCAVFPDSGETANDMANVRNGQYPIWGPLHLFLRLDGNGYPANAKAGAVAGYIAGTRTSPPGIDVIRVEAASRLIPQCAMRVSRTRDMAPPISFAPAGACGCHYEKLTSGATGCKACAGSTECPATTPVCSYGYCETQ